MRNFQKPRPDSPYRRPQTQKQKPTSIRLQTKPNEIIAQQKIHKIEHIQQSNKE